MAMARQNQEESSAPAFVVEETDPTRIVTIARDGHLRDNKPVNFQTSIHDFYETLSSPDPRVHTKDGPGWLAGMTTGGRKATAFPSHEFAVIDADSSILPDGRVVDGAPPPRETEEALISLGLTHCLYTTYSHGSSKGHRYRIVFPAHTSSKAQLRGVILYLVGALQNAGVPIALTRESYTVPSRWHFPRTETSDAPFYSAVSFAYNLTHSAARYLAMHFQQVDENEQEIPTAPALPANEREPIPGKLSLMDTFCSYFSISEILLAHGYTFAGHHVLLSETGRESPAMRFKKPGSNSEAGVIVFEAGHKERLYSHHQNDVLATGKALDAFDVYMELNGIPFPERLIVASKVVSEYEFEVMSRKYPILMASGNKWRVAEVVQDHNGAREYKFVAAADWKLQLANQQGVYVYNPGDEDDPLSEPKVDMKDRADWWHRNPSRKTYRNVVFEPLPMRECLDQRATEFHVERGGEWYFNLFAGWPTLPKQGDWSLIAWHIKNALCGGDEGHYAYFLDWLAHLVQYPLNKPNVAVVLRGGKGSGKSILMSAICRSLGGLGMVVSRSKHLTGDFNHHLKNKLFVLVEESFFSGSPTEESTLKHLISDTETTFEAKGYDPESGRSFMRAVLVTNATWAAPASDDERRYFIPKVTNAAILRNQEEGGTYFTRLSRELAGGGVAALFYDLMNRSIDEQSVRKAPDSAELQEQKLLTLSGSGAWLMDCLMRGRIPGAGSAEDVILEHAPRTTTVPVTFLVDSLTTYQKSYDASRSQLYRVRKMLEDAFGTSCQHAANDLVMTLPALEELRERFCQQFQVDRFW